MVNNIQIALSDHRANLGKIEKDDPEYTSKYKTFNGTFVNVTVTPAELLLKIREGFAYTAPHGRYRHSDYFQQANHLALDFDTEDFRSTFEFLLEDEFIAKYASFIHTTPSHTDQKPRARVVFILDRPIKNKDKYGELAKSLVEFYGTTDQSCKDPARFFYGSKGCKSKWIGNTLPLTVCAELLIKPHRERVEAKRKLDEERTKNRIIVAKGDVEDVELNGHSEKLLLKVREAGDGYKYTTLRNVATTFGGYIASGYYNIDDVKQWLQNAIRQNPNNVVSANSADRTIDEAINYGMNNPLYFEKKDNETVAQQQIIVPELDRVHPKLTDGQKLQIIDVIGDREWKLYHTLMKDKGIDVGYPEVISDHLMLGFREKSIDDDGVIIPEAMTVPFYVHDEVVAVEFREQHDINYSGNVGLYHVKPMFNETSSHGIILPDSLTAINFYLSGEGNAEIYGLPQTNIKLDLPDKDLYCIITGDEDIERLAKLDALGVQFIRVSSLDGLIKNLSRIEIEAIATKGMRLESVI